MTDEADPAELPYWVEDVILERFAKSTVEQRLVWLEEMRTFSWNAASPETRARWRGARDRDRGLLPSTEDPSRVEGRAEAGRATRR